LGRRKTTTSATTSTRNRSVVDHLRSTSQPWQNSDASRSRPVSWHPSSVDALNIPFNPSVNGQDLSLWNFPTVQVNGLITPLSYPPVNEPQIQELFTPLDELPGQDMAFAYGNGPFSQQPWLAQGQLKGDPYSFNNFHQPTSIQPSWQFDQQCTSANIQTAPSSPDYLPIQTIGLDTLSIDNAAIGSKEDSEELVGMGLYDSPAEVQSSSLLFGRTASVGRRALKLEESFEPVEADGEEEEEDDDDDEGAQGEESGVEDDTSDETFDSTENIDYSSQSIANHLTFETQSEVDPIASKYLATLGQLNTAYYPTGYPGYGWI